MHFGTLKSRPYAFTMAKTPLVNSTEFIAISRKHLGQESMISNCTPISMNIEDDSLPILIMYWITIIC